MSKIYGIIPVGGKGKRLGLPFSKEMLPQKSCDFYNPILNHLVVKMEEAGAEKIIFVHGQELKMDIANHYTGKKYRHINQISESFAGVLRDGFYSGEPLQFTDKFLFGLPDSIFEGNPFLDMLKEDGIVCGLFNTLPSTKVDRLIKDTLKFQIKSIKTEENMDVFWGVIKFDAFDLWKIVTDPEFDHIKEIGEILNGNDITLLTFGSYIDLGTWENLNEYWKTIL